MNKNCVGHAEAIEVVKGRLYAGSGMKHTPVPTNAVILDLAGLYEPKVWTVGIHIPGVTPKRYIRVEWPDMSVPSLTRDQWRSIHRVTRRGKLYTACMGGHGRTGVALAILAHLHGAIPAKTDPVAWIRDNYCHEAVETSGQCHYVQHITGLTVTAKGGKSYTADTSKTLCPSKVGADYCNLLTGHKGEHDTTPLPKPTTLTTTLTTYPLSASMPIHPAKKMSKASMFCSLNVKCMWPNNHAGNCTGLDGAEIPLGGK